MQPGQWNQDLEELNLSFLKLLREAMSEDPALAAEEFGFVGKEEKLSMLTALGDEQLRELAKADVLFGITIDDEEAFNQELENAVRAGPAQPYVHLLVDDRNRPLRGWQQERRIFDLMCWMVIRQHTQENALVAKAIYRFNSAIDISRIRRLSPKGVHRLAMWGGNSKLRISDALILFLTMLFNGIEGNLLLIASGAMQTSGRHVDSNVMI